MNKEFKYYFLFLLILFFIPKAYTQVGQIKSSQAYINNNICSLEIFKTDSLDNQWLDEEKWIDKHGRVTLGIGFTKEGDTLDYYKTYFMGDTTEVNVFYGNGFIDTLITYYDTLGRIQSEYWYWDEDQETDTTFFFYKDTSDQYTHSIIAYPFGNYVDSLFYENGHLVKQLDYNPDGGLADVHTYQYNENGLLKTYKKNEGSPYNSGVIANFTYDEKGQKTYYERIYQSDKEKYTHTYQYYDNGRVKEHVYQSITSAGELNFKFIHTFNKKGLKIQEVSFDDGEYYTYTYKYKKCKRKRRKK